MENLSCLILEIALSFVWDWDLSPRCPFREVSGPRSEPYSKHREYKVLGLPLLMVSSYPQLY